MKKIINICLVLFLLLFLFGCESKEEKLQKQIDDLKTQAIEYEKKADFDNAIDLYKKVLNLKEDPEIRNRINKINIEKESVEKTKVFLSTVKDIKYKLDTVTNMKELSKLLIDNKKVFEEFETIDISQGTEISEYVKEILNSNAYKNFRKYYDDKNIKEAELNSRVAAELDKISGGITFTGLDYIIYDSMKGTIELLLDSLPDKLPEKYNKLNWHLILWYISQLKN